MSLTTIVLVVLGVGGLVIGGVLFLAGWDVHTTEARQVDELIQANRAKPRPGMATRDGRRYPAVVARRSDRPE